jgi:pyruvate dehydrogenase E1 component
MYVEQEDRCYYLTVGNEPYAMPAMPAGSREGILRGLYRFRTLGGTAAERIKLLGSGAIMNEVLRAQQLLHERYGVASEAWVATSYPELLRDGLEVERWNRLNPERPARVAFVEQCLGRDPRTIVVAVSDYVKTLPCSIRPWLPGRFVGLGTDGFGRSDSRAALRDYFEVDARHVAWAVLTALARVGERDAKELAAAAADLGVDRDKPDPAGL